jgi:hypothetical protein
VDDRQLIKRLKELTEAGNGLRKSCDIIAKENPEDNLNYTKIRYRVVKAGFDIKAVKSVRIVRRKGIKLKD